MPRQRPRLCAGMIVRNAQHLIEQSLGCLRELADEIVVLDTGSTDETVAIAARCGAKVGSVPWTDFSAARNELLRQATADWLLWLDAGERLLPGSPAEIRAFVDGQADPRCLYLLMVETPGRNGEGDAEQMAQPRLMPLGRRLRFEGPVSETVRPSADAAGLRVLQAPGRILCHPRHASDEKKRESAARNLQLLAAHRADSRPLTPRLLVALGEAYLELRQPAPAQQAFEQAIRTAGRASTEMLAGYYGLLACLAAAPAQVARLLGVCGEALEVFPLDVQLLTTMGGILQAEGRLDLAERSFQLALEHGEVDLEAWHLVEVAEVATVCLASVRQLRGNGAAARQTLIDALARVPQSPRLRRQLLQVDILLGQESEAIGLAQSLACNAQEAAALPDVVRGACRAARREWTAALACLQAAYVAGCRAPICLRWLAVTLLSNGQREAAEPIVRQWYAIEPQNREVQAYLQVYEKTDGTDPSRQYRFDQAQGGSEPTHSRASSKSDVSR